MLRGLGRCSTRRCGSWMEEADHHRGTEDTEKGWRLATYAVVLLWIAAMSRLFIADVCDEPFALVLFADAHQPAGHLVSMILKSPMPFWRPIPTIFTGLAIHLLPFNVAWPSLRIVNM